MPTRRDAPVLTRITAELGRGTRVRRRVKNKCRDGAARTSRSRRCRPLSLPQALLAREVERVVAEALPSSAAVEEPSSLSSSSSWLRLSHRRWSSPLRSPSARRRASPSRRRRLSAANFRSRPWSVESLSPFFGSGQRFARAFEPPSSSGIKWSIVYLERFFFETLYSE